MASTRVWGTQSSGNAVAQLGLDSTDRGQDQAALADPQLHVCDVGGVGEGRERVSPSPVHSARPVILALPPSLNPK